jgi:hypothetical protein
VHCCSGVVNAKPLWHVCVQRRTLCEEGRWLVEEVHTERSSTVVQSSLRAQYSGRPVVVATGREVVVHGSGHVVGCWDAVLADLTTLEQNAKVFTESFAAKTFREGTERQSFHGKVWPWW